MTSELIELQNYLTEAERAEIDLILSSSNGTAVFGDALSVTLPPDPVAWIHQHFRLYDTGQLLQLHPCQIPPLSEALRTHNGRFVYDTVLWSWPKKSAKSTVVAAIADMIACHKPRARIRLTGNDQRQADSRVGMYMRENVKLGAKAGDPFRQQTKISTSGYNIRYPNGSIVEMVPIDPSGEAGGNDDMIVFSELWGWKHKAHQDMWAELTISPNRHGYAQRWIDTYAGFTGESPILEQLYDNTVKTGEHLDIGYTDDAGQWRDLECYANGSLFATWVTAHHLPWQTPAYYAAQARELTPDQFDRMHGNRWVSAATAFIPMEWWDACRVERPLLERDTPIVLGVDAAVTNDCFAIVGVSRHDLKVAVRYARIWTPPPNGEIDFREPEAEIRRLCSQYNIVQVAYDRTELQDMMQRLRRDKVAWCKKFDQGAGRLAADKQLHDTIRDRRVIHGGEPDLTDHIQNANAEINKHENKLRIVKRADNLKIDAAVALSMAASEALRLNI